jgi:predicted PurR-regulated permease PerM
VTDVDRPGGDGPGSQTLLGHREAMATARTVTMQRGFWWRATLAGAVALILGLGTLAAIRVLAQPLAVLVLGLTVASALVPLVDLLGRKLPRVAAIVIVYLAIPLLLALLGYFAFPPLINQLENVTTRIPDFISQVQPLLNRLGNVVPGNLIDTLTSHLSQFVSTLVSLPFMILRSLVDLIAIIFISLYALVGAPNMRKFVLSLVPPDRQEQLGNLLHNMVWEMGGYLRGAFLDGLIIGLTTYVGLLLIGVDFPLVLGLIAGLLEIVPAVGPVIAAVPMLLVALLQSPTKALITLVFAVGIHQFEGNLVFPNVMRSQTNISPLLVLVALLSGYAVGGLLGALTAIPVVAVSRVFLLEVVAPAIRRQTGAPAPEETKTVGTDVEDREE